MQSLVLVQRNTGPALSWHGSAFRSRSPRQEYRVFVRTQVRYMFLSYRKLSFSRISHARSLHSKKRSILQKHCKCSKLHIHVRPTAGRRPRLCSRTFHLLPTKVHPGVQRATLLQRPHEESFGNLKSQSSRRATSLRLQSNPACLSATR